jgi:hypothetical protein
MRLIGFLFPVLIVLLLASVDPDLSQDGRVEVKLISNTTTREWTDVRHLPGRTVTFHLLDKDFANVRPWLNPGSVSPNLTPDQAVAKAQPHLSEYVDDPNSWILSRVILMRFADSDHWIYEVLWNRPGLAGDACAIPVLMSGSVVSGVVQRGGS